MGSSMIIVLAVFTFFAVLALAIWDLWSIRSRSGDPLSRNFPRSGASTATTVDVLPAADRTVPYGRA
jgi:hypothetical protein